MTSIVRIGMVGAGAIAQVAHLPVLSKLKGAQLVALCDSDGVKGYAMEFILAAISSSNS